MCADWAVSAVFGNEAELHAHKSLRVTFVGVKLDLPIKLLAAGGGLQIGGFGGMREELVNLGVPLDTVCLRIAAPEVRRPSWWWSKHRRAPSPVLN